MNQMKIMIYFLIGAILISTASAAEIHGTVYDLSLKKANNAKVEIDTLPRQVMIAANGTYSFNVPGGSYKIKAQLMQKNTAIAFVQENITITQDGIYVLDLILFPDIEEGVEDPGIDVNGNVIESNNNVMAVSAVIIVLLIAVVSYYFIKQEINSKQKSEASEETSLQQIMNILQKEGGRATQKEIRKQIPLSEAKISLMIAELEHKGIIGKIKKGRGNIIILKEK